MVWSADRNCIVDYLGTHQHLAVDLHASVDAEGGIRFRSGDQRFYERRIAFRFPMLLSGIAEVREWYDDGDERFRISVDVRNRRFGRLFGYRGWFHAEWTGTGHWERVRVTADQVPRITPEFLAEERKALGDRFYLQEYFADFSLTLDAVFDPADIAAALADDVKPLFG